jgi:hypothetical protein
MRLRGAGAHEEFTVAICLDSEILILIKFRIVEDLAPSFEQKRLRGGKGYGAHGVYLGRQTSIAHTRGKNAFPDPRRTVMK